MNPIVSVILGLSLPLLFGFLLGYRMGQQAKAKEILDYIKTTREKIRRGEICLKCGYEKEFHVDASHEFIGSKKS